MKGSFGPIDPDELPTPDVVVPPGESYACDCDAPVKVTFKGWKSTGLYHPTLMPVCPYCGKVAEMLPETPQ